jgi:tRNA(Ile)-lysidine synthase
MLIEDLVQQLKPGRYVIAVSGGVDSVSLLDIISKQKDVELIVAHLNHGIRDDSKLDQKLVGDLSKQYGFKYETKTLALGSNASEQLAREARYEFLSSVMRDHHAQAIITAHHSDDVIETSIINLLRGTGRKGVTSLRSSEHLIRPLLDISKDEIKQYATQHNLVWREDLTNVDLKYSRNQIRHRLAKNNDQSTVNKLRSQINNLKLTNELLDKEIDDLLVIMTKDHKLDRLQFINLSYKLALEVMADWLRKSAINSFDSRLLNKLVVAAKTYKHGSKFSINKTAYLLIETEFLEIKTDHN